MERVNLERYYPIGFVVCASVGAIVGHLTGDGAIRGLVDGMMVAVLPLFLLMLGLLFMSFWRPILPTCRCGQCNHKGYQYLSPADDIQTEIKFKCPQCERVYVSSNTSSNTSSIGRFDEITSDGRTVPYMHFTKWGRWKSDQSPAHD